MTECDECGASLFGEQVVALNDGPFNDGEKIPMSGKYYEKAVGYVRCGCCGSKRLLTPKQYYNPPDVL